MFAKVIKLTILAYLATCIAANLAPTATVSLGPRGILTPGLLGLGHHHHHLGLKNAALGAGLLGLEAQNLALGQEVLGLEALQGLRGFNGLGGLNLGLNRGLTDVQSLLLLNEVIAKLLASISPSLTFASPLGLPLGHPHATAAAAIATSARESRKIAEEKAAAAAAAAVAPEAQASENAGATSA